MKKIIFLLLFLALPILAEDKPKTIEFPPEYQTELRLLQSQISVLQSRRDVAFLRGLTRLGIKEEELGVKYQVQQAQDGSVQLVEITKPPTPTSEKK